MRPTVRPRVASDLSSEDQRQSQCPAELGGTWRDEGPHPSRIIVRPPRVSSALADVQQSTESRRIRQTIIS